MTADANLVEIVKEAIPYGRENAMSRGDLCFILGVRDRKLRDAIEQARRDGAFIFNAQDGKGYYQSDDVEDLKRQYKQDTNRALAILARRKAIRKRLKELGEKV